MGRFNGALLSIGNGKYTPYKACYAICYSRISLPCIDPMVRADALIGGYSVVAAGFYVYQEQHVCHSSDHTDNISTLRRLITTIEKLPSSSQLQNRKKTVKNESIYYIFVLSYHVSICDKTSNQMQELENV